MGFSNTLKSNAVNEWKDYYLDYDKLRFRIKNKDFRTMLYNEVNKINSFYFLLERKAVDEKNTLFDDIIAEFPGETTPDLRVHSGNTDIESEVHGKAKPTAEYDEIDDIDFSHLKGDKSGNDLDNANKSMLQSEVFSSLIPLKKGYNRRKKEKHITEFLHSLIKIKAYRDLNATGLLKLARRYANMNTNEVFYAKFHEKLKETYFYKSKRIDSIRNAVKKMYKQIFAKGQPEKAKSVFKRIGKSSKTFDVFYMASGLLIGSSLTLSLWMYNMKSEGQYNFMSAINNIFLGFLLFGLCLKTFKNFSINYKFIFNFDVVSSLNNSIYFMIISTFVFLNSMLFFYSDILKEFTTYLQMFFPLAFLFNPLDMMYLNSRIYLISVYARGFFLPLSTIRFRHFYFIDILQSFKYPFVTIVGYFMKDAHMKQKYPLLVFSMFPFLRGLQCMRRFHSSKLFFPHVANAGKYVLIFLFCLIEVFASHAASGSSLGTLKNILRTVSTLFSFFWDILVDWAVLRHRFMFPPVFYLFSIFLDFAVRFYWVFIFGIWSFFGVEVTENPIVVSVAEIFRRAIWTVIRVEVEHLNNCDELKLKKAINLTAGELFYKKDIEESYQGGANATLTETEFETEMEDKSDEPNDTNAPGRETTASEESNAEYENVRENEPKESTESHEEDI